ESDLAVVDQQPVALLGVVGQALVGGRHPVVGADDVLDGDAHGVAGAPLDRAAGERTETDLRALQVGEDADGPAGVGGRRAYELVDLLVVVVVAVAEVHAGDVHPRFDEVTDLLRRRGRGAQGAYDLRSSAHACTA